MSVKKALLVACVVILLMIPLAELLRTQNPWNCFNLTYDESYFAQAISNWTDGRGFRTHDQVKPFDPLITVGLPMAWGTQLIQKITRLDTAHAGRTFVYFCFYGLLVLVAGSALRRTKNWIAPVFVLFLFTLGIRGVTYGSYFVYGLLSETPAIILGLLAMLALDRRRVMIAGLLATSCFIMKPTFLFLLPAVSITAVLIYGKRGLIAGFSAATALVVYWIAISESRDQTLIAYLSDYSRMMVDVSQTSVETSIFSYYRDYGWIPALLTAGIFVSGAFAVMQRNEKDLSKYPVSRIAAFLLVGIGFVYYLVVQKRPVEKQWAAMLCLALPVFALSWGNRIAERFRGAVSQEVVAGVFLTVIIVWVVNVPTTLRKQFRTLDENACPSKEQRYIGHFLRSELDAKRIDRKDIGVLISSPSFNFFLYELGWNPAYRSQWKELGAPLPKYVVGQSDRLFPVPAGCKSEWTGSGFSIVKCGI